MLHGIYFISRRITSCPVTSCQSSFPVNPRCPLLGSCCLHLRAELRERRNLLCPSQRQPVLCGHRRRFWGADCAWTPDCPVPPPSLGFLVCCVELASFLLGFRLQAQEHACLSSRLCTGTWQELPTVMAGLRSCSVAGPVLQPPGPRAADVTLWCKTEGIQSPHGPLRSSPGRRGEGGSSPAVAWSRGGGAGPAPGCRAPVLSALRLSLITAFATRTCRARLHPGHL